MFGLFHLQTLASRRLSELQEALQIQLNLSQQLQQMQVGHLSLVLMYYLNFCLASCFICIVVALISSTWLMQDALVDDQGILSSRPYLFLNEQIHHLKSEVERYRGLVDQLQVHSNL